MCVSYRAPTGRGWTEKGFLGGLGLNKYWPLMSGLANNIITGALILHITEEVW